MANSVSGLNVHLDPAEKLMGDRCGRPGFNGSRTFAYACTAATNGSVAISLAGPFPRKRPWKGKSRNTFIVRHSENAPQRAFL